MARFVIGNESEVNAEISPLTNLFSAGDWRLVLIALVLLFAWVPAVHGQYLIGQRVWSLPSWGNYFSAQLGGTNFPPYPFFAYDPAIVPVYSLNGSDCFIYDDGEFLASQTSEPPPDPGEGAGDTNSMAPAYSNYTSNDLWLEITTTNNPANFVFLTLHGTGSTNFYQLQSKTNLAQSDWTLGQTLFPANDGETDFDPIPTFGNPDRFFRAQRAEDRIRIVANDDALEPTNNSPDSGHTGSFHLFRDSFTYESPLTVFYRVSGAATMGSDYTNIAGSNLVGSLTFPADPSGVGTIFIQPLPDNIVEFEEPVTVTLIGTNSYIVAPDSDSATVWIADNFGSNVFTVVAADLQNGAGIGYHPGTNSLIVSVDSFTNSDINFVRIDSNGVISPWSGVRGNVHEKKLTVAQATTNGFTRGEVYFGTDANGAIGRISADGSEWTDRWAVLTTDTNSTDTLFRGGFYIDQSGLFGGQLIAVTGGDDKTEGGQVWLVNSNGGPAQIAAITNDSPFRHLEGVLTVPNDVAKWGPWAGKIITGAESKLPPLVHTIDTNGLTASFKIAIEPEDFDFVQTNQDLYCLSDSAEFAPAQVLKLSRTLLTNFWGQMMITQEGTQHLHPDPPKKEGKLFFVQWDSATSNFLIRRISINGFFEHATFAPVTLPNL